MTAYLDAMNRYFVFTGRATRRQFWTFTAIFMVAMFIAYALETSYGLRARPISLIFGLAHLTPFIAISVRRLHDTGRSGWWYLLNAVPLGQLAFIVLVSLEPTPGANRYGDPVLVEPMEGSWSSGNYQRVQPGVVGEPVQATAAPLAPNLRANAAFRPVTASPRAENQFVEQLERLAALRASGSLTDEEFSTMKTSVIAQHASEERK